MTYNIYKCVCQILYGRSSPKFLTYKLQSSPMTPRLIFTKRQHGLPPNLVQSRSHKIGYVIMILSLWNLTGTSAGCCRVACQISERLVKSKPEFRGFYILKRSSNVTPVRLMSRGPSYGAATVQS